MLPGLGLLRRGVTLALCGAAFWAGLHFAAFWQADACAAALGAWDPRGFCAGARP